MRSRCLQRGHQGIVYMVLYTTDLYSVMVLDFSLEACLPHHCSRRSFSVNSRSSRANNFLGSVHSWTMRASHRRLFRRDCRVTAKVIRIDLPSHRYRYWNAIVPAGVMLAVISGAPEYGFPLMLRSFVSLSVTNKFPVHTKQTDSVLNVYAMAN